MKLTIILLTLLVSVSLYAEKQETNAPVPEVTVPYVVSGAQKAAILVIVNPGKTEGRYELVMTSKGPQSGKWISVAAVNVLPESAQVVRVADNVYEECVGDVVVKTVSGAAPHVSVVSFTKGKSDFLSARWVTGIPQGE